MELSVLLQSHILHYWVLAVLFFGMFLDANITIIGAVFLVHQNFINPFFGIPTVIVGAFGEQLFWFWLGHKINNHQRISRFADKLSHRYDRHLLEKLFRSLMVSKFIYGLHRAVLVRIGMLKVPFKKFIKSSLIATGIWLGVMFAFGFAFSASYNLLKQYVKYGQLILLLIVAAFFIADYFISKRLEREL